MFHLGRVFLLDLLLRPRVPRNCAEVSASVAGFFGIQPCRTLTLGQTWVKNCL
jgi:hypothetical protein